MNRLYSLLITVFALVPLSVLGQDREEKYLNLARSAIQEEDYRQALRHLDSATLLNKAIPEIYVLKAQVYEALGNPRMAIESYDNAITYGPNEDSAYVNRARLRNEVHDHRDYSLQDIGAAIEIVPDFGPYYVIKAYYLTSTDNPLTGKPDYELAIETLSQAIQLEPANGEYYDVRGKYKFDYDQPLAAISDFTKAMELGPSDARYVHDRGLTYLVLASYDQAIDDFTLAIKLDPLNEDYLQKRGHAKFNLRRYNEAIDDFTLAINTVFRKFAVMEGRVSPDHPLNEALRRNYLFRGSALLQTDAGFEACQDFRSARDLGDARAARYVGRYCY